MKKADTITFCTIKEAVLNPPLLSFPLFPLGKYILVLIQLSFPGGLGRVAPRCLGARFPDDTALPSATVCNTFKVPRMLESTGLFL